jgi:hypothetical protein
LLFGRFRIVPKIGLLGFFLFRGDFDQFTIDVKGTSSTSVHVLAGL